MIEKIKEFWHRISQCPKWAYVLFKIYDPYVYATWLQKILYKKRYSKKDFDYPSYYAILQMGSGLLLFYSTLIFLIVTKSIFSKIQFSFFCILPLMFFGEVWLLDYWKKEYRHIIEQFPNVKTYRKQKAYSIMAVSFAIDIAIAFFSIYMFHCCNGSI